MCSQLRIIIATSILLAAVSLAFSANTEQALCLGIDATPAHGKAGTRIHLCVRINEKELAELKKTDPTLDFSITWTTDAGTISSDGAKATLDTTGLAPGEFRVHASMPCGYGHTLVCDASIQIDSP